LKWAVDEARLRHATIDAVMAWTPSPIEYARLLALSEAGRAGVEHQAAETLDRALNGLDPQVTVERSLVRGRPASVLVKQAASADLLVVGTRGIGTARQVFLGSTSHGCAHHATVPVVIVPHP
jgi:nucleotide-binding universal stress UspA family protein